MGNQVLLWAVVEGGTSTYHNSWSAAQKYFRYLTRQGKSPEMFTITEDRLRQWAEAFDLMDDTPVAVQIGTKMTENILHVRGGGEVSNESGE